MVKNYLPVTDSVILTNMGKDVFKGWQLLIDKYAPMMYGCIYKLTESVELSCEILEHIFEKLNSSEIIKQVNISPAIYLFHFTQTKALCYLNDAGKEPVKNHIDQYRNFPLLKLMFCDSLNINEVAEKLNLSTNEIGHKLREESNKLRLTSAFNNLED